MTSCGAKDYRSQELGLARRGGAQWRSARSRHLLGKEELRRSSGVSVEVLQNDQSIRLMREIIRSKPALRDEDVAV